MKNINQDWYCVGIYFLYIHVYTHIYIHTQLLDTHRNCKVTPCYIFHRLIHTPPHLQSFIAGFLRLRTHTSEGKKKIIYMLSSCMCQNAAIRSNFKNPGEFRPEFSPTIYESSRVQDSSLHDMSQDWGWGGMKNQRSNCSGGLTDWTKKIKLCILTNQKQARR